MKITNNTQARGSGHLTVRALIDLARSLDDSSVPPEAHVTVHHGEGQRGEPSWTLTASWTQESS